MMAVYYEDLQALDGRRILHILLGRRISMNMRCMHQYGWILSICYHFLLCTASAFSHSGTLSTHVFPELRDEEVKRVAETIYDFYSQP